MGGVKLLRHPLPTRSDPLGVLGRTPGVGVVPARLEVVPPGTRLVTSWLPESASSPEHPRLPQSPPAVRGNLVPKTNFGAEKNNSEFNLSFGSGLESEAFQSAGARGKGERRGPSRRGRLGGTSGIVSRSFLRAVRVGGKPRSGSPRGCKDPKARRPRPGGSVRPPPGGPPAGMTASRPHLTGPPRSRAWALRHEGR